MSNTQHLPKTRLQIASEYYVDARTLMRRLKKRGINIPSGLIYPASQKIIYDDLGYPNEEVKVLFQNA